MQDEFDPESLPTLEEIDRSLGNLAAYVEGQQILLDFLFDMLAGNLSETNRAVLRQSLRQLLEYPDEEVTRPVRRVLEAIGTPKPHLHLVHPTRDE